MKKFSQTDKIFRVVIDSAKDIAKARRLGAVPSTSYFALNFQLSVTYELGFWSTQNLANEHPTRNFLESFNEVEDILLTGENDSDDLSDTKSENSGSKNKFAKESNETDEVFAKGIR